MSADGLPPPSSGVFLEVSFRRSLNNCEEIISGDCKGREDLKNWQTSPFFHHCIETLQEQLAELSTSSGNRIEEETLQKYKEHVDALAARLSKPEFHPLTSRHGLESDTNRNHRNSLLTLPTMPLRVPALPTNGGQDVCGSTTSCVEQELKNKSLSAHPSEISARHPSLGMDVKAAGTTSMLQTQTNLQEDLTEELAGMAASLKSSTLAVEGKLRERGELLDGTETALDDSLHHTRKSASAATKIHSKGRMNLCMTLLVMMVVGAVFAGMFVFIKFTSFAGYRAVQPLSVPVPPVPGHAEL